MTTIGTAIETLFDDMQSYDKLSDYIADLDQKMLNPRISEEEFEKIKFMKNVARNILDSKNDEYKCLCDSCPKYIRARDDALNHLNSAMDAASEMWEWVDNCSKTCKYKL